ncbi:MAG TPA: tripartite tricarboxylate transporter substrate-binding protein [Beijerinckiaceae bacterium]|jgi:tripartite-type tricarboxylate transporter receptor subunit TctC|nr:tripartite tricarboxylate transporter substrate-binding protein [Beijerinckiaceae bacterium]
MPNTMKGRNAIFVLLWLLAALLGGFSARAADGDEFYKGKQITLVVGAGAGGAADIYARAFAPYFSTHIPGNPKIVIENMAGVGGVRVANYIFKSAPTDGTVIATSLSNVATAPLLTPEGANYDISQISWIGNLTKDSFVGYVWHSAPIQTLEQTRTKEVIMGASAVGAAGADVAILARELFGFKLKLVLGYPDSVSVKLAMEKGEVDGTFGNAWADLKNGHQDWLRDGTVRIIVQHGLERLHDLPDVPCLIEFAKTPDDRAAVELFAARQEYSKPYFAPPGVPAERLAVLRRAFDATVRDPAFVQTAEQAHLELNDPLSGEELAARVNEVAKTSPAVVQRVINIFKHYK